MATKGTNKEYKDVNVLVWKFSHYTPNGNGVYAFTLVTSTGETINGATEPGLHQHIGQTVSKLSRVVIRKTAGGRIKMVDADR